MSKTPDGGNNEAKTAKMPRTARELKEKNAAGRDAKHSEARYSTMRENKRENGSVGVEHALNKGEAAYPAMGNAGHRQTRRIMRARPAAIPFQNQTGRTAASYKATVAANTGSKITRLEAQRVREMQSSTNNQKKTAGTDSWKNDQTKRVLREDSGGDITKTVNAGAKYAEHASKRSLKLRHTMVAKTRCKQHKVNRHEHKDDANRGKRVSTRSGVKTYYGEGAGQNKYAGHCVVYRTQTKRHTTGISEVERAKRRRAMSVA